MQSSQFPPPPPAPPARPGSPPPPPPYGAPPYASFQPTYPPAYQQHSPGFQPSFQPYAPPGAYSAPVQQAGTLPEAAVPLYTPGQIACATFFGSPLGGAIVLAMNERRLGRPQAGSLAIGIGILVSIALMALGMVLPAGAPLGPFGIGMIFGMRLIAQKRQGELVSYHLGAGGRRGSNWVIAGISLAALMAVLTPLVVIGFVQALAE